MVVGGRLRQVADSPQMSAECEKHQRSCAEPSKENEQTQQAEMAEVRNALFTWSGRKDFGVGEEERLVRNGLCAGKCGHRIPGCVTQLRFFRFTCPLGRRCGDVFECQRIG